MSFTDLHTVLCDHLCRMLMVSAVKWVDEVISDAPYAINEEFMKKLFTEYSIDYIIHGDDPCLLPDGTDAFFSVDCKEGSVVCLALTSTNLLLMSI